KQYKDNKDYPLLVHSLPGNKGAGRLSSEAAGCCLGSITRLPRRRWLSTMPANRLSRRFCSLSLSGVSCSLCLLLRLRTNFFDSANSSVERFSFVYWRNARTVSLENFMAPYLHLLYIRSTSLSDNSRAPITFSVLRMGCCCFKRRFLASSS